MKEKLIITIKDLDDLQGVLKSIELLFQKLITYYADKDTEKFITLILSVSVWFGQILTMLGYTEDDFKELQ
jgi:hypothetical protein